MCGEIDWGRGEGVQHRLWNDSNSNWTTQGILKSLLQVVHIASFNITNQNAPSFNHFFKHMKWNMSKTPLLLIGQLKSVVGGGQLTLLPSPHTQKSGEAMPPSPQFLHHGCRLNAVCWLKWIQHDQTVPHLSGLSSQPGHDDKLSLQVMTAASNDNDRNCK